MSVTQEDQKKVSMAGVSRTEIIGSVEGRKIGSVYLTDNNATYLYSACAARLSRCLSGVGIEASEESVARELQLFVENVYDEFPRELKAASGSTGFAGLLPLWVVGRMLDPDIIFESGVFTGSSLWLWRTISAKADVLGFDINLKNMKVKPDVVRLFEGDWVWFDESKVSDGKVALAFFDDHINCAKRILECKARGVTYAIFDDSPAPAALEKYRYPAIPSIPMIMDEHLRDGDTFQWYHRRTDTCLRYVHDSAESDRARTCIEAAVSLDVLGDVLGLRCGDKWLVKLNV